MTKLIQMEREDGKTADVHPKEIHNFAKGGYVATGKETKAAKAPETTGNEGEGQDGNQEPSTTPELSKTAKELIEKNGLSMDEIKATGQDGGITVADVKRAIEAKEGNQTPPAPKAVN